MIAVNGSSFGRFGARLRRYPGGTENTIILATVRGSIPNRRAASRWLRPSICTAWRTRPYSSTPFIPRPLHKTQRATCCRIFTPAQPDSPAASVRDYSSGAYNFPYTYDEWLQFSRDKGTDWQSKGYVVERVEVHPDKFRRYCDRVSAPCNMHWLY